MVGIDNITLEHNPETGLLVLLCRHYFGNTAITEIREYVNRNPIDWDFFYRLTQEHAVLPLLSKVTAHDGSILPDSLRDRLQRKVLSIARDNIGRLQEMLKLQQVFDEKGLRVLPVKGAVLSHMLYGDIVGRSSCDIDYMIQPRDLPEVIDVFHSQGYISESYYSSRYAKYIIANSREHKMYKETSTGKLKIEIQWQVALNVVDIPLTNSELTGSPITIDIGNKTLQTLDLNNTLLLLLAHHGVNDLWRILKHVTDIALFIQKYGDKIEWMPLEERCKRYKIDYTSQVGFLLANQLFGTKVPVTIDENSKAIAAKVLKRMLSYPLIPVRRSFFNSLPQQLMMRDRLMDKVRLLLLYIKGLFVPDITSMKNMNLPEPLFFLYYIIKPFRLVREQFTKTS